jgi:hypothetical protein
VLRVEASRSSHYCYTTSVARRPNIVHFLARGSRNTWIVDSIFRRNTSSIMKSSGYNNYPAYLPPYAAVLYEEETHHENIANRQNSNASTDRGNILSCFCSTPFQAERKKSILLSALIACWLALSVIHGIAMKHMAHIIRHGRHSHNEHLPCIITATSIVTAFQLLIGSALGLLLLWVHWIYNEWANPEQHSRTSPIHFLRQCFSIRVLDSSTLMLAALHGTASIFVNLGYSHDSVPLVQIIKLLEPFETLIWTNLLLSEERQRLTLGVVSSMALVFGATFSLVRISHLVPQSHAMVFALLSGLTMSSRNVMKQRSQEQDNSSAAKQRSQLVASLLPNDARERELSQQCHQQYSSKLEKPLVQFTQLSLHSGIAMFIFSGFLHTTLYSLSGEYREAVFLMLSKGINWNYLVWYPLSSSCSIISLSFCSALTHSLLHAGKGVVTVSLSMYWYRSQPLTPAYLSSMCLVSLGACWYILETHQASQSQSHMIEQHKKASYWRSRMGLLKPMLVLALLNFVHSLDSMENSKFY